MKTTRGIRNNNPLNIRHSADRWKGAAAMQTDKSFVQFETMAYGYRAAWKILDAYNLRFRRERKAYNVHNIIGRWAPPVENDTAAYVKAVVKLSGLGGNENIPRPHRYRNFGRLEKTARLLAAMTCVECGITWKEVDWDAIWKGYDLAWPGQREAPTGGEDAVTTAEEPPEKPLTGIERLSVWDEYWDWSAQA